MSLKRNYYEVLGVPHDATTDQIKKKYRELARKFHPDVVQDKDLGQRVFSQINQAYRVLEDKERRAHYDSTQAAGGAGNAAAPPMQGQTRSAASPANGASQTQSSEPPSAQKTHAITGLLGNAENASMAGKPLEARAFCVKVLEIDPRNVRALEMLGDALTQMGQREDAAVQYRKALQVAPSHSIQAKLTRIEQAGPSTRTIPPGQTSTKPGQTPPPKPPTSPGVGAAYANGSQSNGSKSNGSQASGDKAGGLLGRLLGRK